MIKIKEIAKILNLGIFNKFLRGVIMTKIKPVKLLKKNRGYRIIFFQKSSINKYLLITI